MKPSILLAIAPFLLLAGCVSVPSGPRVTTLPGTGKSFEQFRYDEADCRQYAKYQIGGSSANQAASDSAVLSAAVGTVIGAAAGAAIGGRDGAAVGAGAGLLVGSMAGSNASQSAAYATQGNYDNAFIQCMYAKGHKVPVAATNARSETPSRSTGPAPSPIYYPPPPPGTAPPAPQNLR